jgi:O-antigen/teichoic acid export membrane protein
VQTAARALGVLWLLSRGHGIAALAMWELAVIAAGNLTIAWRCLRKYPQLRLHLGKPRADVLHELTSYSMWAALLNLGQQLIYYSDNLVIAGFISATAVTMYAIGGNLIEYLRGVISSMTTTFTPLASSLEAATDSERLRQLLIYGTRAAFWVGLPIEIALFFRGPTFIRLWMGPEYAEVSGHVLQILVVAQIFLNGSHTPTAILYGTSKHRINALWMAAEAVFNLVLSVLLVRRFGIFGVAWGTLIPSAAVALLLRPQYVCRFLGVPFSRVLWESWLRPMIAAVPYAGACYFADRYWPVHHLPVFLAQMAALLPVFCICEAFMFWPEIASYFRGRWLAVRRESLDQYGTGDGAATHDTEESKAAGVRV